jgi:hypothetical protein
MKKSLFGFTVFTTLLLLAFSVNSKELIREFKGSESRSTPEFRVKAPWIVDWRTHGDYPGQMAVHVSLVSSPSGEYLGKIVTTKYIDNGVKLFDEGGTFRFQVDSSLASWTLRGEELTRAEAETYTVREKSKIRSN